MNERYEVMFSRTCVKNSAIAHGTGPDIWKFVAEYRTKDEALECVKKLIDINVSDSLGDGVTVLGCSDNHFSKVSSSGMVLYQKYRIELVKEVREVIW